jgi:glycosyltransferase involved in cell wall biosynthesis
MGKKNRSKTKKILPFVSVCTPTFNRRPFIPIMFECFKNQTYPKDRIEWIIIDDGTDKIKDLIDTANIPQIKYFAYDTKMTLGKKRNLMHDKTCGDILVYMDDDDYYPPERIEHAVTMLMKSKTAICAGASELYVYFKHIQQMWQCGPYGPNHATAGTFAFKRELLKKSRYNEQACLAEEREFLHGYTIPFVQLEPCKTILVFSHEHNTFDKRKLLDNPHPQFMKQSDKKVSKFIRKTTEDNIKKFFLEDIDSLLKEYAPGEPTNKPDVLKQTKEIEEKRKKMEQERQEQAKQNNPSGSGEQIVLQEPGKPPVVLKTQDVIRLINGLREEMKNLKNKNDELIKINESMQQQINHTNATKIQDLEQENQTLKNALKIFESNGHETVS